MGSETSKPLDPPVEWKRNGNQFQIISPVSDISNPSQMHKHYSSHTTMQTGNRNRRVSRTLTKPLSNHQHCDVPPPSAFYFPTKETERYTERASRRISEEDKENENERPKGLKKMIKKTQKAMTGCFAENDKLELQQVELERRQTVVRTSKTKAAASNETSAMIMESKQRRVSDFDAPKQSTKEHGRMSYGTKEGRRSSTSEASKCEAKARKSVESSVSRSGMQQLLASAETTFVIREAEGLVQPDDYLGSASTMGNSAILGIAGIALHQEDAYFARLVAEPSRYSEVQDSPYVNESKALHTMPSTLDNCAKLEQGASPVSNLFQPRGEPINVKASSGTGSPSNVKDAAASKSTSPGSPVSRLLRFHSQVGQLSETPGVYSDEGDKSVQVFLDETYDSLSDDAEIRKQNDIKTEDTSIHSTAVSKTSTVTMGTFASRRQSRDKSSNEKKDEDDFRTESHQLVPAYEHQSDDDSAVLSYFRPEEKNSNTAFRFRASLPEDPLKQVATLGLSHKVPNEEQVSKLESLFRPILPAMSADDAQSMTSFDPYEIKVTESAPSVIESSNYVSLALRSSLGSSGSSTANRSKQLVTAFSPSMMSIDSQLQQSPAATKVMVSDQARHNSEFLFTSEYGKSMLLQRPARSERDSSMFSISTLGARSRLSQRSVRSKAITVPVKRSQNIASDVSLRDDANERHVRFSNDSASIASNRISLLSKESILRKRNSEDVPEIESKISDLTDNLGDFGSRTSTGSAKSKIHEATIPEEPLEAETPVGEAKEPGSPDNQIHWSYTTKDGIAAVTPHRKGKPLKNITRSPYLRFQAAKSKYEAQGAEENTHPAIDVPAIESKVSDLTDNLSDFGGRSSIESFKSNIMSEPIPEEDKEPENVSDSPDMYEVNWSYSVKDGEVLGVTPHMKGKDQQNATKSPFLRFKSAKNKFTKSTKELPVKSPTNAKKAKRKNPVVKKKTTVVNKSAIGGNVSHKIEALNIRITEARRSTKKHRKAVAYLGSNPRRYSVVDTNAIRTRAIVNYKTDVVCLEQMNRMGAAKFNTIPDIMEGDNDDSSVESSVISSYSNVADEQEEYLTQEDRGIYPHTEVIEEPEDDEKEAEDDISKLSIDSASVATVLQQRTSDLPRYEVHRVSASTYSTSSSGLSNVKKQVFRTSSSLTAASRPSVSSHGTTLSSVLGKENTSYSFRAGANTVKPTEQHIVTAPESLNLSPTQRTPMQASKWRSLAAAAKERDSQKKSATGKARKGLSVRNHNSSRPSAYAR